MAEEEFDHGSTVLGIFEPKRTDNLRACMAPLVGKKFTFEWIGTNDDDDPYPGQGRWWISRCHDPEIPDECKGRWLPREDINILQILR